MILKKGGIKIKTKKSLILRIQDIVDRPPDFVLRPANQPSVPSVCELDQLFRGLLQIFKKRTIHFV